MNDLTLILSLISLGFFGGFTHCVGMCGPFILTQVSNRLQKTSLANFSNFQRLKNLALLPYHLGRISTYSLIGFFCSFLTTNIQDFVGFRIFSAIFLLAAAVVFLNLFFERNILAGLKLPQKIRLPFKSKFLKNSASNFSKRISFLFQNPQGLNGYFLGVILGFIPCGLLYAAFLIAGAIENPALAAIGMIFFGISTFPSLFLTACGGHFLIKFSGFKILTKLVIAINAVMLLFMSLKLIF